MANTQSVHEDYLQPSSEPHTYEEITAPSERGPNTYLSFQTPERTSTVNTHSKSKGSGCTKRCCVISSAIATLMITGIVLAVGVYVGKFALVDNTKSEKTTVNSYSTTKPTSVADQSSQDDHQTSSQKPPSHTTLPTSVRPRRSQGICMSLIDENCERTEDEWCLNDGVLRCIPDNDGWLVWLRRVNGNILFNRNWDEYVNGFGDAAGDYWLGLENLHLITGQGYRYKVRIVMSSWQDNSTSWAEYDSFSVGPKATNYTLHVTGFTGNVISNAFSSNNGRQFSTVDKDNEDEYEHCAKEKGGSGGWWYGPGCGSTLGTGLMGGKSDGIGNGGFPYVYWNYAFTDSPTGALKSIEIKIKPAFLNIIGKGQTLKTGMTGPGIQNHCSQHAGDKCQIVTNEWCLNEGTLRCIPDNDGWLVWLRRVNGNILFNRNWDEYVNGFGDAAGDYWLGLENLHLITGQGYRYKVRIVMSSWQDNSTSWAEYDSFSVGPKSTNYTLHVTGFTGNVISNAFSSNNVRQFSTVDKDNDDEYEHCAKEKGGSGGWWYGPGCGSTLGTGLMGGKSDGIGNGGFPYVYWNYAFTDSPTGALKSIEIKIKPTFSN